MKDKIQTLDYLFQNCKPEFLGGTVDEWLNENSSDTIEKSVDMIRHHPLVPSYVKVRGLFVNHKGGKPQSRRFLMLKQVKPCLIIACHDEMQV